MNAAVEKQASPRAIRGRTAPLLLALGLALLASGCQTTRSWQHGCPGVYSGARFYADQVGWLPFDGKLFFTLDLPLTLVVDTLLLPATAFAEPEDPPGGFPTGCRWADERRY